jgi:hypothetical protein
LPQLGVTLPNKEVIEFGVDERPEHHVHTGDHRRRNRQAVLRREAIALGRRKDARHVSEQRTFDRHELISGEAVDWLANDVVTVNRAQFVDEHACGTTSDLQLGAVDGWTSRGRTGDRGDHP